jgi:hypothetical protein
VQVGAAPNVAVLLCGDVIPSLEHHGHNQVTRQRISNDELRDGVKAKLVIRDSLNHPNR